jgi:hypothetical protein
MCLVLVRVRVFEAAELPYALWLKLRLKRPPAEPPVEPPATQEYDRQAAPNVTYLDAWYTADHRLVAYQRSERQEAPGLEVVGQLEVMVDAGQAVVVDAQAAQNTNVHQCQGG